MLDVHVYIPNVIQCDWCDYVIENPMRFSTSKKVNQMFPNTLFTYVGNDIDFKLKDMHRLGAMPSAIIMMIEICLLHIDKGKQTTKHLHHIMSQGVHHTHLLELEVISIRLEKMIIHNI